MSRGNERKRRLNGDSQKQCDKKGLTVFLPFIENSVMPELRILKSVSCRRRTT